MRHNLALGLVLLGLLTPWGGPVACAGDDVRERAQALIESAKDDLDAGVETKNVGRVAAARDQLQKAKALLTQALGEPTCTGERAALLRRDLVDLDVWLKWAQEEAGDAVAGKPAPDDPAGGAGGAGGLPAKQDAARFGPWLKEMRGRYEAAPAGVERGVLAQRMVAQAGIHAAPTLFALFRSEADAKARDGLHDALATLGTSRVATEMESCARGEDDDLRERALDVIYRALAKPEKTEPERPWCRAVRAVHQRKDRKLTLRILGRLDAMGYEGTAALGEVIYVEDFGYHNHTIELLARRKDRRAVPPLIHKLNRFAFEAIEQMPAHRALLQMGWFAVPELVDALDNKAAGIWISWTLRKITGETMGTDKRKWHDWWKGESVRHPELFDDPEERPPVVTTPAGK